MSTTYHTPIIVGAAANAAVVNAPLGELDAAIATLTASVPATATLLKEWTEAEAYELTAITRTADGVVSSATVKWPDGSAGVFTATTINPTWLGIDAYTITHALDGKTVTQSAVTRDTDGNVITKPALTVV